MKTRVLTLLICILMLAAFLVTMPQAIAQTVERSSVYDYDIVSVTQTSTDEITVKVQARYCSACNPNDASNPGCTPFTCGYPPPYYPYYAGCSAGYPDGRFVAVRIKDGTGTVLGTQKLVCNPTNWPMSSIIARDFVFSGIPTVAGSIIAEADVYCSWCGHWYPSPESLEVAPLKVCIDPGHGGADPGAVGYDGNAYPNEEDVNLDIALKLKALLEAKNIEAVMTRNTDTYVTLQQRCDIANNNDCDIFVSIHCNSAVDESAHGIETYHYSGSLNGLDLAKHVQFELVKSIGLTDRGTKQATYYVLKYTEMPAALTEVAFLTNPGDFEFLTGEVYVPSKIKVLMPNNSVVEMDLDEYLKGVVPNEMSTGWPIEALKAQAVAARCFAATANRHTELGANVCTTTHCQVWTAQHYADTDEAVDYTHNIVATHEGDIIQAYYFGHCDGHTRNSEDVWGGYLPYCRSVPCICGYTTMYGHGVGMCQRGAQAMAEQDYSYIDILNHYYTGVEVGSFIIDEANTEKTAQGIANGILGYFEEKGLTINGYSPIDIVVTDPDGLIISKQVNEIPGATYNEIDLDGDGDLDDQVRIPDRKIGEYIIEVIPEPGALPTDTYTLEVSLFGTPVIVAENAQIADIPDEPYVIESTSTGIVLPVIEATVRIEPETLNLNSKGIFTAFITLPEGYDVVDIDVGTVLCEGASAVRGMVSKKDNGTLIVKFNRDDLLNVTIGDEVELTVVGQLNDGTRFEGVDTISVIE